jgi:hypothetical protein
MPAAKYHFELPEADIALFNDKRFLKSTPEQGWAWVPGDLGASELPASGFR